MGRMLVLTTSAHPTMLEWEHPNHGRLVQPRHYSSIRLTAEAGIPWAADNDGFNGVDEDAFERMVCAIGGLDGCRFVAVPDVVGDAERTMYLYEEWAPVVMRYGLPAAWVAQDGATASSAPWGALDAVFIGGSDYFKTGDTAMAIAREARRRGKWLHVGRVNGLRRIRYAQSIEADSIDGTKWAKHRDVHLAKALAWAASPPQMALD